MTSAGCEFVAGWNIVQTLGEGAYGEVKLLINQDTGEAVAMKVVDLGKHPDAVDAVRKEICLHRMLKHENVIKFFGSRRESSMQYMFLEYAVGGELFDRIEPDVGMPQEDARKYFAELIAGVNYLHQQGVAHRDLKPENLLLDEVDCLKITDFGMATLFRYNGMERELERRCGTKPYMAPEVMVRPYNAEPADIWSCGIILVAMLAGELPWDEPSSSCSEYTMWKDKSPKLFALSPWNKIDNLALSLLRKILNNTTRSRATTDVIRSHQWMSKEFQKQSSVCGLPAAPIATPSSKRNCSELHHSNSGLSADDLATRLVCSQPAPPMLASQVQNNVSNGIDLRLLSFSQPAKPDQLLLSTQLSQGTQLGSQTPLQRLVKRMTRVLVRTSHEDTIAALESTFIKFTYSFRIHTPNIITVTTVDRRGAQLVFKASVLNMGPHILVDFRLSKGCGLDFKRHFLKIREQLCHIIIKGPVTWSMALATNMLPA